MGIGNVFNTQIQARLRDVNLGGHVDNVEAIRVVDEARVLFLRFASLDHGPSAAGRPGLLRGVPAGVADLVGSQRVDYRTEMRFVAYQPFLVRLWISHVGRSSFAVSGELRVDADRPPALLAMTSVVLWDRGTDATWPMTEEVRADLERYRGEPVALHGVPRAQAQPTGRATSEESR